MTDNLFSNFIDNELPDKNLEDLLALAQEQAETIAVLYFSRAQLDLKLGQAAQALEEAQIALAIARAFQGEAVKENADLQDQLAAAEDTRLLLGLAVLAIVLMAAIIVVLAAAALR